MWQHRWCRGAWMFNAQSVSINSGQNSWEGQQVGPASHLTKNKDDTSAGKSTHRSHVLHFTLNSIQKKKVEETFQLTCYNEPEEEKFSWLVQSSVKLPASPFVAATRSWTRKKGVVREDVCIGEEWRPPFPDVWVSAAVTLGCLCACVVLRQETRDFF